MLKPTPRDRLFLVAARKVPLNVVRKLAPMILPTSSMSSFYRGQEGDEDDEGESVIRSGRTIRWVTYYIADLQRASSKYDQQLLGSTCNGVKFLGLILISVINKSTNCVAACSIRSADIDVLALAREEGAATQSSVRHGAITAGGAE